MRVSLIKWKRCPKHNRWHQNLCYYCAMDWSWIENHTPTEG